MIILVNFTLEVDRFQFRKKDKYIPYHLIRIRHFAPALLNRGKVLTRNQLFDDVQNNDAFIVDRNIDVHIAALRKKLGPNFHLIETVRGVGYRFLEEDE